MENQINWYKNERVRRKKKTIMSIYLHLNTYMYINLIKPTN